MTTLLQLIEAYEADRLNGLNAARLGEAMSRVGPVRVDSKMYFGTGDSSVEPPEFRISVVGGNSDEDIPHADSLTVPTDLFKPTLDSLAKLHGTDKQEANHGYTKWYQRHFRRHRDEDIKLLEIGVGTGASLRMWRDYFHNGDIHGLDINPDCMMNDPDNRITIWVGDQGDPRVLIRLIQVDEEANTRNSGQFNVIIDDGSHRWDHVTNSFGYLWPHLAPGGFYVIEDLHTSYWPRYSGQIRLPTVELTKALVDTVNRFGSVRNERTVNDMAGTNIFDDISGIHFHRSIVFIEKET